MFSPKIRASDIGTSIDRLGLIRAIFPWDFQILDKIFQNFLKASKN